MASRVHLSVCLSLSLLVNVFCGPLELKIRSRRDEANNELGDSVENTSDNVPSTESPALPDGEDEKVTFDEDDDDFESMQPAPTGGSNILSLLRLASAFFPGSSGTNPFIRNMIRELVGFNPAYSFLRRQDVRQNEIKIDYVKGLKPPPPPFQRQETDEEESESEESEESVESDENNGAEESVENNNGGDSSVREDLDADDASNSSDDYDEPPEGDGQGGGILGLLAGLSGGEDGQSDLGDLLATVGGIVGSLSGDGVDVNALIGSGLGLFVGLLSEGEENPGAVIASYILTSLETITGGGAQNNGAFFGNFLSKLIKGTSAAINSDESSEDENKPVMADSAGFLVSVIMGLLGDMSKGSSGGSWRREDIERIFRAEMANRPQ